MAATRDGRLPDGTRLPSERSFAEAAGLSRSTTTRVYAALVIAAENEGPPDVGAAVLRGSAERR
nr:GntR family transcriptional regulator [uncultured Aeromicrobium sp.]